MVLIHHANKVGGANGIGIRGSGAWAATVDVIMELGFPDETDEKEDDPQIRQLNILSRYEDRKAPLLIDKAGNLIGKVSDSTIMELVSDGVNTQTDLVKRTNASQPTISRHLTALVERGLLVKKGRFYRIISQD